MTPTVSRTRGLCKAGPLLDRIVADLHDLLRLDEFPCHAGRESVRATFNRMAALRDVRDADRKAGLHRGGEPHDFHAVPADDLDADLLPFPAVSGPFPVGADF